MLLHLKEYCKYVEITGYRNVEFALAEAFLKTNRLEISQSVEIQFFDADLIATQEHLLFAVINSLEAFKNKTNLSKSPAMETILYASAQRQIQKAIQQCGIKPSTTNMATTIIGENPTQLKNAVEAISKAVDVKPDQSVLEMSTSKNGKIRKVFQISNEEINTVMKGGNSQEALVNLVFERAALLATQI
jgi:tRNA threonylcarbamoyladenosine modification (KEOPS) complex Cgi121 subunit